MELKDLGSGLLRLEWRVIDYRGLSGRRPSWGSYVPGRWPGLRDGGPLGLGRGAWPEGVLFSRFVNVVEVGVGYIPE